MREQIGLLFTLSAFARLGMGSQATYHCTSCGYRMDEWMSSGYDVGMMSHAVGITCGECQRLYTVWLPGNAFENDAFAANRDAITGRRSLPPGVLCPADQTHHIAVWIRGDPCPRCGQRALVEDQMIAWD